MLRDEFSASTEILYLTLKNLSIKKYQLFQEGQTSTREHGGPSVRRCVHSPDMPVTVLNALGIEKGKFMRGRVLEEIYGE